MVICRQPAMRAPFRGWDRPYSARIAISPGISASARRISFRPHSARLKSFTLKGRLKLMLERVIVDISFFFKCGEGKNYWGIKVLGIGVFRRNLELGIGRDFSSEKELKGFAEGFRSL